MVEVTSKISPFKIEKNKILILNQTLLPSQTQWEICLHYEDVVKAIKKMYVRGAPAIGIAAAFGFYLAYKDLNSKKQLNKDSLLKKMYKVKQTLDASRPTAINLMWATSQMYETLESSLKITSVAETITSLFKKAQLILEEDKKLCLSMANKASQYIIKNVAPKNKKGYRILTHCNTGALATGGIGTALGVIRYLHHLKKVDTVYVDETRPYMQGARLTTYELHKENIPFCLITDSSAGFLMQQKMIDFIIVGADRITKNGDVANKIGTYSLSILAKHHKIPFYVIAPKTTVDTSLLNGNKIPIEEREANEVRCIHNHFVAFKKSPVKNYSFDITPRKYIKKLFIV